MTAFGNVEVHISGERGHRLLMRTSLFGPSPSAVVHWWCPHLASNTPVCSVVFFDGESVLDALVRTAQSNVRQHYVDTPNCKGEPRPPRPTVSALKPDEAERVRTELAALELRA